MIEKKIFYLILLILGIYLLFTQKGLQILNNLTNNITGNAIGDIAKNQNSTSSNSSNSSSNTKESTNSMSGDIDWNKVFGGSVKLG